MSTSLVLGNGNILVNIDERLQVCDFFFPHIGQENHLTTISNKLFFRINGEYTQLTYNNFDINIAYQQDSLVGLSKIIHKATKTEIVFHDFVVPNENIFVRKFDITNNSDRTVEIFTYFQNNFAIYENDIGDTAVWYQPAKCLVHYKKNRYIGVGSTERIYQFTCAARTDNNNKGAFPNLSTGKLDFNPISNGSVNSCISYKFEIEPGRTQSSNYINIVGSSFKDIEEGMQTQRSMQVDKTHTSSIIYWQNWVRSKIEHVFQEGCPQFFEDCELNEKIYSLYKRSLLTIRTQIDNDGAVLAANDGKYLKEGGKDTYSYFWPRDGAYIILAMIECDYKELSDKYFEYISKLITEDGYFLHKYYPHGSQGKDALGSSWHPWIDKSGKVQLPIQEDETALNLYVIWKHYEKFADQEFLKKYWNKLIFPMANFLGNYRYTLEYEAESIHNDVHGFSDIIKPNKFNEKFAGSKLPQPSYDLWEEKRGITAFTCASVYAGLIAASKLSGVFGRKDLEVIFQNYAEEIKIAMSKYLYDEATNRFISCILFNPETSDADIDYSFDTSLYALWHFGVFDIEDEKIENTMRLLEEKLNVKTEIGGMARREKDFYNRIDDNLEGNPWFICTLWLSQYWIKKKDMTKAEYYLRWVVEHADKSGLMAEQANPHTGHGESVKPLAWSHSEFVRTVNMIQSSANSKQSKIYFQAK
jgi:GH15 family glucan-1,4-alpha-glucosidase